MTEKISCTSIQEVFSKIHHFSKISRSAFFSRGVFKEFQELGSEEQIPLLIQHLNHISKAGL